MERKSFNDQIVILQNELRVKEEANAEMRAIISALRVRVASQEKLYDDLRGNLFDLRLSLKILNKVTEHTE
jgi:hypothetical protein